ncbi:MAG: Type 1 glutamine amidotransferase-like domain-containing protein [Candidatus Pacebacteria bacterium]|nr:Type 1 glutamine amidotransferase-like domain-containing protein [Candidatus Paceibacterota bacterium]
MKLFLAAEAKNPASIRKLRKFIGGSFKGKKIAYVPTASNGEYYGAWKGGESIKKAMSLGADLKIVQLEDACYRDVIKPIREANILWMAGGMSGYLLYWIRRVKLDKALPGILEKGTIYVGSSAGSMICAKTQYSSEWYLGEPEPGASLVSGLGLIDFEIYPHYEEKLLPKIKKLWKSGELYLLKNGEVITVVNEKIEVLGKRRVIRKEEK